jgi:hypothetical protein
MLTRLLGRRSQTKMAVGSSFFFFLLAYSLIPMEREKGCLRYSRADYLRKLVRRPNTSNMQFIHRSVGEPAEGSLTRYPIRLTKENCFHPPFTENERGSPRC